MVITLTGAFLGVFSKITSKKPLSRGFASPLPPTPDSTSGIKVLIIFATVCLLFISFVVWRYWQQIVQNEHSVIAIIGLFLTMVGGMLVRVVTSNYEHSQTLSIGNTSKLVFPILLSPIVFFPVWSLSTGGEIGFFTFHAAFLNGYFWESVVSSTRLTKHRE
jgi:hypothetical protein